MKSSQYIICGLLFGTTFMSPLWTQAQEAPPVEASDSDAIKQAALDYIDGWYTGDAARMEHALHPRLVKRIVVTRPTDGRNVLLDTSALELMQQTREGGGENTSIANRREEVRILDHFGNMASVRIDATDWVDYLQLALYDGRWVIVNVLWTPRQMQSKSQNE